jgi:hypothetical protein
MTDRPARWPDTPDIVTRLRSRREAWVCIREEAASEIEKLRKANLRLLGEVSRLTDKLNTVTTTLHHYAASDGLLAPLAAAVLREIEESK